MHLEETSAEDAVSAHNSCPLIGGERTPFPILFLVVLLLPLYFLVRAAAGLVQLHRLMLRKWHVPAGKFPDLTHA